MEGTSLEVAFPYPIYLGHSRMGDLHSKRIVLSVSSASMGSEMSILLGFLVIALFPCPSHNHPPHLNNATDQHSLWEFKASITDDPLHSLADWNLNISFCNWTGVTCSSRRQRVVALELVDTGLQGSISPFLANLSFLRSLYLVNNSLHGPIPPQLGRLFRLRELVLSINNLEGRIPTSVSDCRKLVELALSYNNLSGSIPSELGSLARLELLYLSNNSLTGSIPSSLSNISTLAELDLSTNLLTGAIPPELGMLTNLNRLLYLFENQLTGQIPASLSNCTSLQQLILHTNHLSGNIPKEFGTNLLQLQTLSLWNNQLTGSIPTSLGNCSKLTELDLSDNRLHGVVPTELGKLLLLQFLDLQDNQLVSGSATTLPFLTALTNCSLLGYVSLGNNNLGGMLPTSIGQLSTKLSTLSLLNNGIGGSIPHQIGNLTNLTFLALFDNSFAGSIPSAFGRLQKLEQLYLFSNRLEGRIPREIGQLKGLGLLSVHHNMLYGKIPDSLGNLQQLRRLYLNHNQLSGNIPLALGNCKILELLDLSHNRLSGNIPGQVAGLQNLLFYWNLSWNSLQGSLPSEISKITMAQSIDVSGNKLTGIIPEALGSCIALTYLNLSRNAFHGPVPTSLGKLQNLQDMDLSFNFLSGMLPKSLNKLEMLRYVDLSSNNLTGEISEDIFANHTTTALFMGNPGLCGPRIYSLPPCPKHRSRSHSHSHSHSEKIIVIIAAIIAFALLCLIVLFNFLWSRHSHRRNLKLSKLLSIIAEKIGHPRISYQDLVTATGGFDDANLLGVGNFGSVYKGILGDGTIVAVKVLNLQNEEACKSFATECKVLGRARHKNLVPIITSCSNLNFKGLVLQFMSNGSLEKHLYPHEDQSNPEAVCGLSLSERLNILVDIAHGMSYLHHDCFMQVVHCDLKPSNMLLDDNMTAHVTDFGIARLTGANSMDSLTSTLALRGSVGYIAPEYGLGAPISTNGDVYSFGIVLLEILTRKRPTDNIFVDGLTLQKWVSMAFPSRILEVVDSSLLTYPSDKGTDRDNIFNCLIQLVHLALLCTNDSPEERPSMREIVGVLERIRGTFVGTTRVFRLQSDMSYLLTSNVRSFESQSSSTS